MEHLNMMAQGRAEEAQIQRLSVSGSCSGFALQQTIRYLPSAQMQKCDPWLSTTDFQFGEVDFGSAALAVLDAGWVGCTDDTGADDSAHVPRRGLRPLLLLDFAAPSAPVSSSTSRVGLQCLNTLEHP